MKTWDDLRAEHLPACVYCGAPADTRDHVIPQHWRRTTYTVPACRHCNSVVLRGVPLFTVEDRAGYVAMHKKTGVLPAIPRRKPRGASPRRAEPDRPRDPPESGLTSKGDPSSAAGRAFPSSIRVRRVVEGLPSVLNYKSKGWYVKGKFYSR